MKIIIFSGFVLLSALSFISKADTEFIQYRGINVPIGEARSVSGGSIVTNSAIETVALTNRTDRRATLAGRIANDVLSVNSWFVIRTGALNSSQNECENFTRRSEQVLNESTRTNIFTANNLLVNTEYTAIFCTQNINGNGPVADLATTFQTMRNDDTVVTHDCRFPEVFRSSDGPLNIRVQDPIVNSFQDSATFLISNRDVNPLSYRRTIGSFGVQTVGNRVVDSLSSRRDNIRPTLSVDESGNQVLLYGVRIFGAENWTAEFSCRNRNCLDNGNPAFRIPISCSDTSPL